MLSKDETIDLVTIGDSLTQGHPPPHNYHPGKYQHSMLTVLEEAGYSIMCRNHGIGGQEAEQIAIRVPEALPCDIISIMAGTNDCWRYAQFSEEMAGDMRKHVMAQLERAVMFAKDGNSGSDTQVILCSIPPTRPGSGSSPQTLESIKILRERIEELCQQKDIIFCDVYKAMSGTGGQAQRGLVKPDGVHFTDEGNKVCGTAIGETILSFLESEN